MKYALSNPRNNESMKRNLELRISVTHNVPAPMYAMNFDNGYCTVLSFPVLMPRKNSTAGSREKSIATSVDTAQNFLLAIDSFNNAGYETAPMTEILFHPHIIYQCGIK